MYIPENYRICELEAEHGEAHILYEWKEDVTLRSRWPDRQYCAAQGWRLDSPEDYKAIIAAYHWKAITGGGVDVEILSGCGWSSPSPEIETEVRYAKPVVVIRVELKKQYSQYLGWISPEDFHEIQPANCSHTAARKKMRRKILQAYLLKGLPVAAQVNLFE